MYVSMLFIYCVTGLVSTRPQLYYEYPAKICMPLPNPNDFVMRKYIHILQNLYQYCHEIQHPVLSSIFAIFIFFALFESLGTFWWDIR